MHYLPYQWKNFQDAIMHQVVQTCKSPPDYWLFKYDEEINFDPYWPRDFRPDPELSETAEGDDFPQEE